MNDINLVKKISELSNSLTLEKVNNINIILI